jgi:CubicO group peptidase (beta-lactamase class C family)
MTEQTRAVLDSYTGRKTPGIQYIVVTAAGPRFEHAGGWADIRSQTAMTLDTTMMAYSMTKTITAVAVLQLVEQGKLGLDDELDRYLPDTPYRDRLITIRHLIAHTAGLPNPIPLRWAHLAAEDAAFDEDAALAQVLAQNPKLKSAPGAKFAYSNIGYWLLGKVVEQVTGQPYVETVRGGILRPLGLAPAAMDFVIPDPARHANGYLAKYSLMNLIKGLLIDAKFWDGYAGNWLRFNAHHLNGPAFGGLVGTARSFGRFLQDQLQPDSALFNAQTKALLQEQQRDHAGNPIPMTLGWHIGQTQGIDYFFKEGGGGGFHSEMRLYPAQGIGTVVMVNNTEFNTTTLLNTLDVSLI